MANRAKPEKYWNMVAAELTAEGWRCDFARVDTGTTTVFILEGHRDGVHHIIVSDELLPALLELPFPTRPPPSAVGFA